MGKSTISGPSIPIRKLFVDHFGYHQLLIFFGGALSFFHRSLTSPECKKQKVKTKKGILTSAKVDPAEVHTRVPSGKHSQFANLKPWPSRSFVDFPSYKMVIFQFVMYVNFYQMVNHQEIGCLES